MTGDCREKSGSTYRGTTQQAAVAVLPCPRKQVPHAKDSPRPAAKLKHVKWEKQLELGGAVRGEGEGLVAECDPVGRKWTVKHQGRKIGVKGKLQWLFEQDRLYWEVPAAKEKATTKESSSPPSVVSESDAALEQKEEAELIKNANVFTGTTISPGKVVLWSPVEHLSDSVNLGEDELEEDGDVKFGCSSSSDEDTDNDDDHGSSNFDLEVSHLEMNAPEIEVFMTTPQAPAISGMGGSNESVSGFASSSIDEIPPACFETRNVKKDQDWRNQAVVMEAKCELLKMEKEFAQDRWKEGCEQMTQAAEMAHSLRATVEAILEPIRQTVIASESCTPCGAEEEQEGSGEREGLLERLERLQICSDDQSQKKLDTKAQLHLEHQTLHQALRDRIDILQRKSKLRNMDTSTSHNIKENCEKQRSKWTRNLLKSASISSTSSEDGSISEEPQAKDVEAKETVRKILAQIQVEAEQWTQVQDVLKHVCTEMSTLQQACQTWEKRALDAEFQAAACQLEGDEWRVKAQTAQQRIKEVEVQMLQLQETVHEIKLRHVREQNRWLDVSRSLGPTNILGYTLALQPISNNKSCCDSCGRSLSTELEECRSCGKLRRVMVEERQCASGGSRCHAGFKCHSLGAGSVPSLPSHCRRHASVAHGSLPRFPSPCMRHATTGSLVARAPSPCRSATQQETHSHSGRVRQKYHNQRNQQLMTHTCADNVRAAAIAQPSSDHKPAMKSEVEKSSSSSQGESQQQTTTRQQQMNLPAQYGHITKPQNQENMKGSGKSFAGMQRKGGVAVHGQSPMRKIGQPLADSFQGSAHSSSFNHALQRAPLKDVSANIIPGKH